MLAYMATEFGGRGGHERLGIGASFDLGVGPYGRPPGLASLASRHGSLGWSLDQHSGRDDGGSETSTPPHQASPGNSFDEGGVGGGAQHDVNGSSCGSWDTAGSAEGDHLRTVARALLRRRSSNEVNP